MRCRRWSAWWPTPLALLLSTVCGTHVVGAQVPPTPPPAKQPPVGAPKSLPVRATVRQQDSLAKRQPAVLSFEFEPADSVMRELLDRPGFRHVQYQGGRVFFDAKTRELILRGKPSAVKRDETMLVGDTITYNDSTKRVVATGDTVWLRDPGRAQSDDFVARGRIDYDLESRSGQTGAFST
ncbi:MAG: hypothetical protein ABMA00_19135, partial [Gemmatimonas sp.]